MKKIWKWLMKHIICLHEGHDYIYREAFYDSFFVCNRCGKVSKNATWSKEE